jgi:hypothetical protein
MLLCGNSFGQQDLMGNKRVAKAEDFKGVRVNLTDVEMWNPILGKFGAVLSAISPTESYDASYGKGSFISFSYSLISIFVSSSFIIFLIV